MPKPAPNQHKNILCQISCFLVLQLGLSTSWAEGTPTGPAPQSKSNVDEIYFAPPPMPRFMLEKPERPLTQQEMQQQIEQAQALSKATQDPNKTLPENKPKLNLKP
jgi:hypothetical protein